MTRRIAIVVAACLGLLWPQAATAATITVNTTNPNTGFDGQCSLIEAITNADHGTGEWSDCTAGTSGADVINLASSATYTFTGALTNAGQVGALATPVVTTTITINGNGSTITRTSPSGQFRYFYVAGGSLTLNDLTVTGASLPATADGTIYNDNGALAINRSTLFGNGGPGGGAVTNRAAGSATATLTITDSIIRNNTSSSTNASYGAGAGVNTLAVNTGTATTTITNTRIANNTATNQGAGVSNAAYNNGATSTTNVVRSSITGNTTTGVSGTPGSSFGGGIANFVNATGATARMTVTNTTLSGNAAQNNGYGGGVFNEDDCGFGAASCGTVGVTLENVTIANNSAGTEPSGLSRGGGIWSNDNGGGSATTTLRNTLLSSNTDRDCRDVTNGFVRAGYNIATDSTCGVNQFSAGQLKLGALDTSGQTYFHTLQSGSAAIDKVDTTACTVTVDQLGAARPFGSKCDVGAIESNQPGANLGRTRSDFDGDGRSDAGIFRPSQMPNALWYAPQSGGGAFQIYFGASGDVPVPADYDGDVKADAVIFRPSTGLWYGPRTGAASIVIQMTLGQSGDIPVPCDYDGDGAVDPAYFRPSTGLWFGVKRDGSAVVLNTTFGQSGDKPVPADYDGDGKCDPGIYRGSATPNALWYAPLSGGGVFQIYFGAAGDIPVPADYDGDGKADAAIFRPTTGLWYGPRTGGSTIVIQMTLGQNGDIPIPADYDGDAAADAAIYRPSSGLFYGVRVQNGAVVLNTSFGAAAGDVPLTRRPGLSGVYPY